MDVKDGRDRSEHREVVESVQLPGHVHLPYATLVLGSCCKQSLAKPVFAIVEAFPGFFGAGIPSERAFRPRTGPLSWPCKLIRYPPLF